MTGTFNGSPLNGVGLNSAILGTPTPTPTLVFTSTLKAVVIAPPETPSPWSIDPQRTQQLPPAFGS